MRTDVSIRPEHPRDFPTIIPLVLRAFAEGTDYSDGTDVLAFIEEIRMSPYYVPELSFVAELAGRIAGHFLFSRFPLSPSRSGGHGGVQAAQLLMLAPVAVHPDYFRQGVGTAMLTQGLALARESGLGRGVLVEGDNLFYNRFGFRTSTEFGIHAAAGRPLEEPRFQMCMETAPGSLAGVGGYVVYDMYHNT